MKNISFTNDVLPLKGQLYRLALRITLSHEEAEDIVQDTLIKIWNRRDALEGIESIEAFSLTICRNLALDHLKRHASHTETLPDELPPSTEHDANPYELMLRKDRLAIVKALIDALPEKQRSCIQLREMEGKSYKEIAQVLGITEEQVKINIFRARQTLKQNVRKYEDYDRS